MMDERTATLSVSGLHCGACEAVIRRALSKLPGISRVSFTADSVSVDYQPGQSSPEAIGRAISEKGYRVQGPGVSFSPPRTPLSQSLRSLATDPGLAQERETLLTAGIALVLLVAAQHFILRGLFPGSPGGFWPLSIYLILTVVLVGAALRHFLSFRRQASGMTGMMVGMTIGMVSGFLAGAVMTVSNGIFIGSVYGMGAGMLVGSLAGRCCGIMGIMEGMMAGIMSGVMGGMVPLMFLSDNIFNFLPVLTGSLLLVLVGLTYHLAWENREYLKAHGAPVQASPVRFLSFLSACFIVTFLTTALMVFGPKSALVGIGIGG